MINKIIRNSRKSLSSEIKSQEKTSRKDLIKERTKDGTKEPDRLKFRRSIRLRSKKTDLSLEVELFKSQNFSRNKTIAKLLLAGKLLGQDK